MSCAAPALTAYAAPLQWGLRSSQEYVAPAPAVSLLCPHPQCMPAISAAPDPVVKYIRPAKAINYATPVSVVEYVSPALVTHAARALWREHRSSTNAYLRRANAYSACSTTSSGEVHSSRASGGLRSTHACAVCNASPVRCTHADGDRNQLETLTLDMVTWSPALLTPRSELIR